MNENRRYVNAMWFSKVRAKAGSEEVIVTHYYKLITLVLCLPREEYIYGLKLANVQGKLKVMVQYGGMRYQGELKENPMQSHD